MFIRCPVSRVFLAFTEPAETTRFWFTKSPVEWEVSPRGPDATQVSITATGFTGTDDEKIESAIDSMGGPQM